MKKDSNCSKLFFKFLTIAPSGASCTRHLRIADIIADDDETENDGDDCVGDIDMSTVGGIRRDGSTKLQCSSPRRILSRCLALLRRNKERKVVVRSEKRVVEFGGGCAHTNRSINVMNSSKSSFLAIEGEGSGQSRKDVNFNLGVGCSLIYLIAASKNELTKMVELRTQMEVLLQNVREELQTKNASLKPFDPNANLSYSTTNDPNDSDSDGHLFELNSALCVLPKETVEVADESSCVIKYEQEHCVVEMDVLEAELEVELERMQLNMDSEHSSRHPQQQKLKAVVDTASAISQSLSSGEVIDPQGTDAEINSGVSHIELERKLRELVEARQQERIKELEAALECAVNKLHDKELEVSWWKDTARLISQHLPAPSRLISHPDPKNFTCRGEHDC